MSDPLIVCPRCSTPIKLTDTLAAPLIAKTRKQFEQQLAQKDSDFARREESLRQSQKALAKARQAIDDEVAKRLQTERVSITEAEKKKARIALAADLKQRDRQLAELRGNLDANNAKLAEAQRAHAEVLRKSRELDDAKRELDLSVQKKVQESLASVRDQAKAEAEDGLRAKVSEREAQISGMQRQIEELSRKADQGSQQLQGEALERELESLLRTRFPQDVIEPVRKGQFGGDILHRVQGPTADFLGAILWECKRTKAWNDVWLAKLRDDQRSAKAEIALIISTVLPKGLETFDLIDGNLGDKIALCDPACDRFTAVAERFGKQPSSGSRSAKQNGNGLPVSYRTTFSASHRGDHRKIHRYASRSRSRAKNHDANLGQARGAAEGRSRFQRRIVRRPPRHCRTRHAGNWGAWSSDDREQINSHCKIASNLS
jgi:hypothetical protein